MLVIYFQFWFPQAIASRSMFTIISPPPSLPFTFMVYIYRTLHIWMVSPVSHSVTSSPKGMFLRTHSKHHPSGHTYTIVTAIFKCGTFSFYVSCKNMSVVTDRGWFMGCFDRPWPKRPLSRTILWWIPDPNLRLDPFYWWGTYLNWKSISFFRIRRRSYNEVQRERLFWTQLWRFSYEWVRWFISSDPQSVTRRDLPHPIPSHGSWGRIWIHLSFLTLFSLSFSVWAFLLLSPLFTLSIQYSHRIQIAGHQMTVIAVDGIYVTPTTVDVIHLFSGYRMDVLIVSSTLGHEWVSLIPPPLQTISDDLGVSQYEISAQALTYTNVVLSNWTSAFLSVTNSLSDLVVTVDKPADSSANFSFLNDFHLKPLRRNDKFIQYSPPSSHYPSASHTHTLTTISVLLSGFPDSTVMDSWNGIYFVPPVSPLLLTPSGHPFDLPKSLRFQYTDLSGKNYVGRSETAMITVTLDSFVDILLDNAKAHFFTLAAHPLHLHGHHFWVLGEGVGSFSFSNQTILSSLNLVDPPFRDTYRVPPNGWTLIRFKASSPGAWTMHCHTIGHSSFGMDRIIIVDRNKWPSIPKYFPKCGKYIAELPLIQDEVGGGGGTDVTTEVGEEMTTMERTLIIGCGGLIVALMLSMLFFHFWSREREEEEEREKKKEERREECWWREREKNVRYLLRMKLEL